MELFYFDVGTVDVLVLPLGWIERAVDQGLDLFAGHGRLCGRWGGYDSM